MSVTRMEHCRHEDSIALVKSVLRLPNRGYRFHAFKGGAILGRHRLSRVVLQDSEVGRKGGLVSTIDGLASGKRFTGCLSREGDRVLSLSYGA